MFWLRMRESSRQVQRFSIIGSWVHFGALGWLHGLTYICQGNLLINSHPVRTGRPHIPDHDIRENLPSKLTSTRFWRPPFQMQAPPPLSPEKRSGAGAGAGWDTWGPPGCSFGRCHAGHTPPPPRPLAATVGERRIQGDQ